ncbi:MAG: hypothetical protein QXS38_00755 [Candidatus Pacearchaeota archaeon]
MESIIYNGREEGIYKLQKFPEMIRRIFPGAEIDAPLPTHASVRISASLTGEVMMQYLKSGDYVSVRLFGDENAIENVRKVINRENNNLLVGTKANNKVDISGRL